MIALRFTVKKMGMILIIVCCFGQTYADFFDRLPGRSLQSCIHTLLINRRVYLWYLNNNIETMNDVQRTDLLAYLQMYKNVQPVNTPMEKTGNLVYTALESATSYAPKRLLIAEVPLGHTLDGTNQLNKDSLQLKIEAQSHRDYVWFYGYAHTLVKNKSTDDRVRRLLRKSYEPLFSRPRKKS